MIIWGIELRLLLLCSSESGSSRFAPWCSLNLSWHFDISKCLQCSLSHYAAVKITWNELLHITHLAQSLTHNKYPINGIYRQSNRRTRIDILRITNPLLSYGSPQARNLCVMWYWFFPYYKWPQTNPSKHSDWVCRTVAGRYIRIHIKT